MHSKSSTLSPYGRYKHLRRLLKLIKAKAKSCKTPFSILCYGSASYGFNPKNCGKFDDLDLFMIIPTGITVSELLTSIKEIFPENLLVDEGHLSHLLVGDCEICRLYCRLDGVKVGFRLIPHHILSRISYPS